MISLKSTNQADRRTVQFPRERVIKCFDEPIPKKVAKCIAPTQAAADDDKLKFSIKTG